jgi:hypothetical protein
MTAVAITFLLHLQLQIHGVLSLQQEALKNSGHLVYLQLIVSLQRMSYQAVPHVEVGQVGRAAPMQLRPKSQL